MRRIPQVLFALTLALVASNAVARSTDVLQMEGQRYVYGQETITVRDMDTGAEETLLREPCKVSGTYAAHDVKLYSFEPAVVGASFTLVNEGVSYQGTFDPPWTDSLGRPESRSYFHRVRPELGFTLKVRLRDGRTFDYRVPATGPPKCAVEVMSLCISGECPASDGGPILNVGGGGTFVQADPGKK